MFKKKISLYYPENDYVFEPFRVRLDKDYETDYNIITPNSSLILNYAWELLDKPYPKNIPLISIFLDVPYWRICEPGRRNFWKKYREILKSSNKVLAISESSRKQLLDNFGIDSEVLGLGIRSLEVDTSQIKVEKEKKILYIGNLIKPKRPEMIIEALSYIAFKYNVKEFPKVTFISRPESTDRNLLQFCYELSERMNIPFEFKQIDIFDDYNKIKEIKSSFLLIDTSYCGGLGFPAIESICFETPCIISDSDYFREFSGDASFYFKNIKDLGEKIYSILSNDLKINEEILMEKKNLFLNSFSPNNVYFKLKDYINSLI